MFPRFYSVEKHAGGAVHIPLEFIKILTIFTLMLALGLFLIK